MSELVWFENPGWERHMLASGLAAPINAAAADLNADGRVDLVCIATATANLKWYENMGSR